MMITQMGGGQSCNFLQHLLKWILHLKVTALEGFQTRSGLWRIQDHIKCKPCFTKKKRASSDTPQNKIIRFGLQTFISTFYTRHRRQRESWSFVKSFLCPQRGWWARWRWGRWPAGRSRWRPPCLSLAPQIAKLWHLLFSFWEICLVFCVFPVLLIYSACSLLFLLLSQIGLIWPNQIWFSIPPKIVVI